LAPDTPGVYTLRIIGFLTAAALSAGMASHTVRAAVPTSAERAFVTFEAGEVAFRAADFERAARLFSEAFAVHPQPAYAFNRGLALAKGEKFPEAERVFQDFIKQFPDNAGIVEVKAQLLEVRTTRRQREAVVTVTSVPEGAMARVLRAEVETVCTTPCELRADPGELTIEIASQTARVEQSRTVGAGGRWDLSVELLPPGSDGMGPNQIGAVVLWGVGGVGLVTGVALGLVALGARDDAAALASNSPLSDPDFRRFQRSKAEARDFALGADIGFGVAVAGAVVGTVLWLVGDDSAAVAPSNGGVAWRF